MSKLQIGIAEHRALQYLKEASNEEGRQTGAGHPLDVFRSLSNKGLARLSPRGKKKSWAGLTPLGRYYAQPPDIRLLVSTVLSENHRQSVCSLEKRRFARLLRDEKLVTLASCGIGHPLDLTATGAGIAFRRSARTHRGTMSKQKSGHYIVNTRYTSGSSDRVDEVTAKRAAEEERRTYARALTGIYGEADELAARRFGLRGIVTYRVERGAGRHHGWEVFDLCTDERYFIHTDNAKLLQGYRPYDALERWEKALVEKTPPEDVEPKRAWYRVKPDGTSVEVYRPGPCS